MATKEVVEVIGGEKNFWLHTNAGGWDLTHPASPFAKPLYPRIPLNTTKGRVAIDARKSALVVIDLQNYFLSPALGRPPNAVGLEVVSNLLKFAIPACREAGMPVVWLNWGLTDEDIEGMPPTITKGFAADTNFSSERRVHGLGSDIGDVKLDNGKSTRGGRVLIRDEWNTLSYEPLRVKQEDQDIQINKNRLSGFWGGTGIEEALHARGIRTLLFAGANTDQCVGGSLQDAYTKGWDCLMLSDGCATTSPEFAQKCIEYNTEEGWGFLLTCEDFLKGVGATEYSP